MALEIPITRAVWAEAARDPRLQKFFDQALLREQTRWQVWRAQSARASGVHYSGTGPDPWVGRDCEQILQDAKTEMARCDDHAASPLGRVQRAMADLAEHALKINIIVGQVRAATSRSFDGELPRIAKLLTELDAVREGIKQAARASEFAVDDAYASAAADAVHKPLMKLVGDMQAGLRRMAGA